MSKTTPKMPARTTPEEAEHGLSKERLAELEALAASLKEAMNAPKVKRAAKANKVETAIEVTAALYERSPETLRRAFSDLARAAKWEARSVEVYLRGRRQAHLTVRLDGRVSPETKALAMQALAKLEKANGGGFDDFIAGAAKYIVQHGRF